MDDPKSILPPNLPTNLPIAKEPSSFPASPSSQVPSRGPALLPPPSLSSNLSGSPALGLPTLPQTTPPPPAGANPAPVPKSVVIPRSSIRTMESDIKSAKIGQSPRGMEVKPPAFSTEVVKPPQSGLVSPKPPISSTAPPVGIKLGEAEKRTFPAVPISPLLTLPKQPAPLSPPAPPVKTMPRPPVPPIQGGISIPPSYSVFGNKKLIMLLGLVVLVLLGGILFWRREETPEDISVITPLPSVTITPKPTGGGAISTFTGFFKPPFFGLTISRKGQDPLPELKAGALNLSNDLPIVDGIMLAFPRDAVLDGLEYNFSDFLGRFLINFPINLVTYLQNNDFSLILTKQTEFFDGSGKLIASPSAENLLTPKIALAVRVIDATEARNQLIFWEDTMVDDLKEFYDLSSKYGELSFSDNSYQGVAIRFVNFPYADKSIDYAIITAKNGNDYLIIANSREQIYMIIDKLLGF